MSSQPLNVFIVDDEPSTRMVIGAQLDAAQYQIAEFGRGEDCLAALDQAPNVILLDIEMPGMDGIDVCRTLREAGHSTIHVIFISTHNDLETRMRAYDAGGNDYVVKPFAPEEIEQKLQVAGQILSRHRGLEQQTEVATMTAFTAMSSMGELSAVLQFLQASFACQTLEQLGAAVIDALAQYGLDGLVELRCGARTCAISPRGECSPLEASILVHMRKLERIFQFRDRLAINYPFVTLVVSNLPKDDPDRAGRLRDHLAILVEGANARASLIASETERLAQASGIKQAAHDLALYLQESEGRQTELRVNCLDLMSTYVLNLENSFVHLGLTESQEGVLSNNARKTRDLLGDQLILGMGAADRLNKVINVLQGSANV